MFWFPGVQGSFADEGPGRPAGGVVVVEMTLRLPRYDDKQVPAVFVGSAPDFAGDFGTAESGREIVVYAESTGVSIATPGTGGPGTQKVTRLGKLLKTGAAGDDVVRLVVGPTRAAVEIGGRRVWSGEHGLGVERRYPGVRLIARGQVVDPRAAIASLRVLGRR